MSSAMHVETWGDTGPTVVLVHGGTPQGGAAAFAAQRDLAGSFRLVLPDRPGHGSTPAQGREDFERDAGLLGSLLDDACDGEPVHLVGHSYGGVVALLTALARPAQVRSLTVIEPPAYGVAAGDPAVDEMARRNRELFEQPPTDPAVLLTTFFELVGMPVRLPQPLPPPLVRVADGLRSIRSPHEAHIDLARLAAAGFPVLVLTSGSTAGFEGIASALRDEAGARHLVVPGTSHAVQDAGAPVNEVLTRFWSTGSADTPA